jgi:hypothetical protein
MATNRNPYVQTNSRNAPRPNVTGGVNAREAQRREAYAQHQARMNARQTIRRDTRGLWRLDETYKGHPKARRKVLRELRRNLLGYAGF